jgi:hypothetical protein
MFKSKKIASALAAALIFSGFHPFGVSTALANGTATIDLQAGANQAKSASFSAPPGLQVTASVKLTNNGKRGEVTAKNLTVKLLKPDGSVADSKTRLVDPQATTQPFSLQGSAGGSTCGNWKVEVSNPNDNATSATATATVNFTFVAHPQFVTLGAFGLTQDGTAERNVSIPGTGRVTLTATWDTDELIPDSYELSFRLIRPNGTVAKYDAGYAQNALGVSENNKLNLNYAVTAADVALGTTWKIKVSGSAQGKVKNVKITRMFVPGC